MKNYAIRNLFNVIREYSALIEEKEKNGTDRWLRVDYLENYNEYLKGYMSALYLSDIITDNQYDLISGWRLRQYNRKWNSYINELK
jgi:uncharacterized protein YeeX (DUF496 family)